MIGNKIYRHKDNPEEKRFHDNFIKDICHDNMMSAIVFEPKDGGLSPSRYLTEDEEKIVISAIQWLGSPVGQSFLREMGYEKKPEEPKKVMTDKNRRYVAKRCKQKRGWKIMPDARQDEVIRFECQRIGFTFEDFFAADGKFLNRILQQ